VIVIGTSFAAAGAATVVGDTANEHDGAPA
jgi:hypothetical protein